MWFGRLCYLSVYWHMSQDIAWSCTHKDRCRRCLNVFSSHPLEDWGNEKARQKDSEAVAGRFQVDEEEEEEDGPEDAAASREMENMYYVKTSHNIYNPKEFRSNFKIDMAAPGGEVNATVENEVGVDEDVYACADESKPREPVVLTALRTKLVVSKFKT